MLVVGQGLRGDCSLEQAEVKGCSGGSHCPCCGRAQLSSWGWAGAEGAGEGPAARPVRGSGCPAHAQALVKARQKYQMSWSNICTTFPACTKKAFYTQSTLGDELGKQRGGSPLKLTLWLCTDKASASSSLM